MRKLGILIFAATLTALALFPERAYASYYVCTQDCTCFAVCRWGADGMCGYAEDCHETGGNACFC